MIYFILFINAINTVFNEEIINRLNKAQNIKVIDYAIVDSMISTKISIGSSPSRYVPIDLCIDASFISSKFLNVEKMLSSGIDSILYNSVTYIMTSYKNSISFHSDNDNKINDMDICACQIEALSEGQADGCDIKIRPGRNQGIEPVFNINLVNTGQLAQNAQNPCDKNTDQDGAFDLFDIQDGNEQQTNDSQQRTNAHGAEIFREIHDGNQGCTVYNQLGILQTDKGDKQANTN